MRDATKDITLIDSESDRRDGQIKCPKCGATDISTDTKTGKLRCNFCRFEFDPIRDLEDVDIASLEGTRIRGGAKDIAANSENLITLKCESCGAEVVIDTRTTAQARCHWCRNTLSLNNQIPNGAIPDVILPFMVSKEEAEGRIAEFVNKRKFFAHPVFTREFTTENICGVYLPYMLVDVNGHMNLSGEGEIQTAQRVVKRGDDTIREYEADRYQVGRDFDIYIEDLPVESSKDKLDYTSKDKTTNIINAIMPFDTENCVQFDANYMRGFTSEKRDTNIDDLKSIVKEETSDVARLAVKDTLKHYDRGVKWDSEQYEVRGDAWKAAYLPIWLYSYMQKKGDQQQLHYVAVNARTRETMGSVPINHTKLLITSIIVEIISWILSTTIFLVAGTEIFKRTKLYDYRGLTWLLLLSGFVFYYMIYLRYRNSDERHHYEVETKHLVSHLIRTDDFLYHEQKLGNRRIKGENSDRLKGNRLNQSMDERIKTAITKGILNEVMEGKKRLEDFDQSIR